MSTAGAGGPRWRGWRPGPPVITLGAGGLFFALTYLLGVHASTGSTESRDFVSGVPWLAWRMVAAAVLLLFLGLLLAGVRLLADLETWGVVASPARRRAYLATAAAAVVLVVVLRAAAGVNWDPDLPVNALNVRTSAVLLMGLGAAIPWLALVWLAHDSCRTLWDRVRTLPPLAPDIPGGPGSSGRVEPGPYAGVITQLLTLWQLLVTCVGAFVMGVVAAMVSPSVLRGAFLAAHPDRAGQFPAVNVIYYGALFAVLLTLLAAPLASVWRSTARATVERAHPLPPDGQPTSEWVAARGRLEDLLHLDVPLVRNPLTALTVLTPLLASVLAAFLPQLGT